MMERQIQLGVAEEMKVLDVSRISMRKLSHFDVRTFIKDYHYSHKMPGTQLSLGFYIDGRLNCVVLFGQGISQNLANVCGKGYLKQQELFELCRLFSFDWAPKNMESYCIAQSLHYIEKHLPHVRIIISFADPAQGHLGRIYQATNWIYTGVTNGGDFYVDKRGVVGHPRTISNHRRVHPERSRNEIATRLGWMKIKGSKKHRYLYLLGNRKSTKDLRRRIVHPILPYPKDLVLPVVGPGLDDKTRHPKVIIGIPPQPGLNVVRSGTFFAGEVSRERIQDGASISSLMESPLQRLEGLDTSSFHEGRAGSIPAPRIPISNVFEDETLFSQNKVSDDVLRQITQYKVQKDVLNKKQGVLSAFVVENLAPSMPEKQGEGATKT